LEILEHRLILYFSTTNKLIKAIYEYRAPLISHHAFELLSSQIMLRLWIITGDLKERNQERKKLRKLT